MHLRDVLRFCRNGTFKKSYYPAFAGTFRVSTHIISDPIGVFRLNHRRHARTPASRDMHLGPQSVAWSPRRMSGRLSTGCATGLIPREPPRSGPDPSSRTHSARAGTWSPRLCGSCERGGRCDLGADGLTSLACIGRKWFDQESARDWYGPAGSQRLLSPCGVDSGRCRDRLPRVHSRGGCHRPREGAVVLLALSN